MDQLKTIVQHARLKYKKRALDAIHKDIYNTAMNNKPLQPHISYNHAVLVSKRIKQKKTVSPRSYHVTKSASNYKTGNFLLSACCPNIPRIIYLLYVTLGHAFLKTKDMKTNLVQTWRSSRGGATWLFQSVTHSNETSWRKKWVSEMYSKKENIKKAAVTRENHWMDTF